MLVPILIGPCWARAARESAGAATATPAPAAILLKRLRDNIVVSSHGPAFRALLLQSPCSRCERRSSSELLGGRSPSLGKLRAHLGAMLVQGRRRDHVGRACAVERDRVAYRAEPPHHRMLGLDQDAEMARLRIVERLVRVVRRRMRHLARREAL